MRFGKGSEVDLGHILWARNEYGLVVPRLDHIRGKMKDKELRMQNPKCRDDSETMPGLRLVEPIE